MIMCIATLEWSDSPFQLKEYILSNIIMAEELTDRSNSEICFLGDRLNNAYIFNFTVIV